MEDVTRSHTDDASIALPGAAGCLTHLALFPVRLVEKRTYFVDFFRVASD